MPPVFACPACLLLVLAFPGDEPAAERRLRAPSVGGRGESGPLDWVLEKVASGSDEWSLEKVHDEVSARLKDVASRITEVVGARPFAGGDLKGWLAPGFRSAGLAPGPLERVSLGAGLEVERGEARSEMREGAREGAPEGAAGAQPPEMAGAAFAEALGGLFEGAARLEKSKFKVFRIVPGAGPSEGVATRVLLEADGPAAAGGFFQLRAVWDLAWRREGDGWLLASLVPVSLERARLARRVFAEVTEEALGANPCYRDQLLVGVDAWRTRFDSSSGIDIYGHQGVSVGDFDSDGWEDLYLAQPAGLPNRLLRSRRDGTFEDVTEEAGVGVLDTTGGSLFADLDSDGDQDLVVVTSLETLLFENRGKGRFALPRPCGLETAGREGASSMGCTAADHDRDGDLDLYIFSYVFWAGAGSKTHSSYPYPYHDAQNGAPNFLFRNDGRLRFEDVTREVGLDANNRRFSLAASWCDYDADGDPDLYVANDFGKNNLYRNDGGAFRDVAEEAGVEDTGNGMSVTWEDYDNDGRMDLYVGNMWSSAGSRIAGQPGFGRTGDDLRTVYRRMARGNSLFRNLGGGRFEDVSIASGAYFGRWAWSCQFIDHDSDGREDLYVSNGFVTNEQPDDL
ncbi:MAG: VCBS repeat-containing protein [Planctomycetes bacterium]|nr:VCBS repeat-containing protein [Planctomycetota bacterium]